MTPEQDVLAESLTQIEATRAGLSDAEALIGSLPPTPRFRFFPTLPTGSARSFKPRA